MTCLNMTGLNRRAYEPARLFGGADYDGVNGQSRRPPIKTGIHWASGAEGKWFIHYMDDLELALSPDDAINRAFSRYQDEECLAVDRVADSILELPAEPAKLHPEPETVSSQGTTLDVARITVTSEQKDVLVPVTPIAYCCRRYGEIEVTTTVTPGGGYVVCCRTSGGQPVALVMGLAPWAVEGEGPDG